MPSLAWPCNFVSMGPLFTHLGPPRPGQPFLPTHTETHTVHSSYGHTAVLNSDLVCDTKYYKNYPPKMSRVFLGGSVHKESTCTAEDRDLIPGMGWSPEAGNGNPLQYSCLVNPMDRGPWWATVHRVARIGHDLATKPQPPPPRYCPIYRLTILCKIAHCPTFQSKGILIIWWWERWTKFPKIIGHLYLFFLKAAI